MIVFKDEKTKKLYPQVHPKLREILNEMATWLFHYDKSDLVLVETMTTKEEDAALNRVSTSHQDGRAVDIRNRDWKPEKHRDFMREFSKYDAPFGAMPAKGNIRTFIVDKPHGSGPHFHCQLGKDIVAKLNKPQKAPQKVNKDDDFLS